jgi:hypothetical protein
VTEVLTMTTETAADTEIETLLQERAQIKARLTEINAQLKAKKPAKTERRARGSLTSALLTVLKERGPLSSRDVIETVMASTDVKDTSVRTLLAAMCKNGKIVKTGVRGTFQYSIPA